MSQVCFCRYFHRALQRQATVTMPRPPADPTLPNPTRHSLNAFNLRLTSCPRKTRDNPFPSTWSPPPAPVSTPTLLPTLHSSRFRVLPKPAASPKTGCASSFRTRSRRVSLASSASPASTSCPQPRPRQDREIVLREEFANSHRAIWKEVCPGTRKATNAHAESMHMNVCVPKPANLASDHWQLTVGLLADRGRE